MRREPGLKEYQMSFDCGDWIAIQDNTPGPDTRGKLTIGAMYGQFPTDGYRLELVRRRDGINPSELFFDFVVHEPTGTVPQVISNERLLHSMPVDRGEIYAKVRVFFDDQERWSVDVVQAS